MAANHNPNQDQPNFRLIANEFSKCENIPAINQGAAILRSLNDLIERVNQMDAKSDARYENHS